MHSNGQWRPQTSETDTDTTYSAHTRAHFPSAQTGGVDSPTEQSTPHRPLPHGLTTATLLGSQGPWGGHHQEGPRPPQVASGSLRQDGTDSAQRRLPALCSLVGGGRRLWPSHGWFLGGPWRPQALRGKHLPAPAPEDQRARPLPFLRLPWLRAKDRAVRACWVPRGWGPQAGSIITTTP